MTFTEKGLAIAIVLIVIWAIVSAAIIVKLSAIAVVQDSQIKQLLVQIDKNRELLDDFNRRLAASEIKLQFCIEELRNLRQK